MNERNPFDHEQTDGIDDLQVEYIYEYWGPHFSGEGSYYKDGEDSYDYEQQLDDFKEQLNEFLAEHEIYD
ncbi:MAG: hypothetical protein SVU32_00075, partial [Candidatus Nanohaloarchaea archaeon]|nr:hypothetical protein [Candidatus Nanohaloarchaea archaeon]